MERAAGLGMTGNSFCGLLRTDGRSFASDHSQRHCAYVPGADYQIPSDSRLFNNLDGYDHTCNQTGNKGVRAFQYKQAAENACQLPGNRTENRIDFSGKILSVCYCGKGWYPLDCRCHGGSGL